MFQNGISITQVANGWLVVLPFQPIEFNPANQEAMIRRQAKIMKEEFHGDGKDPLLKKLQEGADEEFAGDLGFTKQPLSEIKENNMFVFKTFPEVLEFLKEKYN